MRPLSVIVRCNYSCVDCGTVFADVQPPARCDDCGGERFERVGTTGRVTETSHGEATGDRNNLDGAAAFFAGALWGR